LGQCNLCFAEVADLATFFINELAFKDYKKTADFALIFVGDKAENLKIFLEMRKWKLGNNFF
jgi:hypothetical protein